MKRIAPLLLILFLLMMVISPLSAQSTNDVLAEGQAEAVLVISETAFNVVALIIGMLIALIAIGTYTALRLAHSAVPPALSDGMIAVVNHAITALEKFAESTKQTDLDDKLARGARIGFDEFLKLLEKETGGREDEQPLPEEPEAEE